VDIHLNGQTVFAEYTVDSPEPGKQPYLIRLDASNIRKGRTGTHAKIRIFVNGHRVARDTFNIERDAETGKLARSAARQFKGSPLERVHSPDSLKLNLDDFAELVWPTWVNALIPELATPLPEVPLEFAAMPHILHEGGTIFFGPGDSGKSTVALLAGVSVDAGNSNIWQVPKPRRTLLINLERSGSSYLRRLAHVNLALGEDTDRKIFVLNRRGYGLEDIEPAVAAAVDKHGIEMIVLDSISRARAGSLTEDAVAIETMDTLSHLCPTWLAIAHAPAGDHNKVFGSVHYQNAADVVVRVVGDDSEEGQLGIGLKVTKKNDLGKVPIMALKVKYDKWGLASVEKTDAAEFPDIEQALPIKDQLMRYLLRVGRGAVHHVAEDLSLEPQSVGRILRRYEGRYFTRIEGDDWGVVTQPTQGPI